MSRIASLVGLVFAAWIAPSFAWDDQGHMMVAAVAYDQLTSETKARVAQLLKLSRYPTNGKDDVKPSMHAKAIFMMAATAPDAIKKDSKHFKNDGEDPTDAGKAPDPDRNSGFDDKYMHKYWHYIDLAFSPDGTPLVQPAAVNARERIGLFRRTIASDAPDKLKAFDLVWLLHLVGDVHQPLHATSRFTADGNETKGDSGGNDIKLVCATKPCENELHAFWDDVLGKSGSVSAAIKAAKKLPAADRSLVEKSDESDWVQESFEIAQQSVYTEPVGLGNGPYTLDTNYKTHARQIAEERVALAGARLANLLNMELK